MVGHHVSPCSVGAMAARRADFAGTRVVLSVARPTPVAASNNPMDIVAEGRGGRGGGRGTRGARTEEPTVVKRIN